MVLNNIYVPPEILDIIVGLLAEDEDTDSIKALALACRTFLGACRARLFATIDLTPSYVHGQDCKAEYNAFRAKVDRLKRVFNANPSVVHLVRNVTYMFLRCDLNTQEFHHVLGTLTRVKSLVLRGAQKDTTIYRTSVDWSTLSSTLRQSIIHILQLSTLKQLCLDQVVNFPLSALISSPNITHLTIESADFEDGIISSSAESSSSTRPPGGTSSPDERNVLRLSSLVFTDYSSGAVMTLIKAEDENGKPAVDLSQLVTLESLDKTGEMVVPTLLDTSQHLETLSCTVWDTFNNPFRDLLKPHTLKTLKIFKPIIVIPPWLGDLSIDPYYSLPSEFAKWAACNILERIEITINVEQNAKIPMTPASWTALNNLADASHFPYLSAVGLRICIHEETAWAKEVKKTLESQQQEIFEDLCTTSRLDFQLVIELL
ncbi:hypothetical protein D9613_003224 [Agrocybe pediades]|uniref:Uncharacterized protein n=1 Tax=Agrocybe pediades TaxID=84607 RepID=A0A8H4QQ95_9AGAR|nr:hypothetical protein D9613_003224 [Agrocybe pediades]